MHSTHVGPNGSKKRSGEATDVCRSAGGDRCRWWISFRFQYRGDPWRAALPSPRLRIERSAKLYDVPSAAGSVYVWYYVPETRGLTLEKIQELLER